MKFQPLHDRVVVARIDAEDKTAGGIIIPDTAKEKPTEGEVIAVGPGGRDKSGELIPIDLKEGDRVLFGKWSGTEVKIDGVEYLIMKESDIMIIIDRFGSRPISTVTQKEVNDFSDHCRYIRSVYLFALRLFKNSSASESESMKTTAPVLFEVLDQVFAEFVVMAACRITDPAKMLGYKNLTVETFVNGFSSDPETSKQLSELHEKMQTFRKKIASARNKIGGHSDRATIAKGQPLPAGSWAEWDEFWQTLANFVRILNQKATGIPVQITTGDAQRDGDMLLKVLGQSKMESR